ncbi:MAG: cell division protein CrgA [Nocardioides sp.]|uniref:cell division protein CrgA n=1 Tax=Nocardioides sp. TaxID=35761 RepID=UPI0039E6518F
MAKTKLSKSELRIERDPVFTPRFLIALLLIAVGIAWIAYFYTGVRPAHTGGKYTGPDSIAKLKDWNYLIGFGLFFLGLIVSAHPRTPLGRGRGVVVGMLGCFLIGLVWICVFYIFSDNLDKIWVFNDLGQKNLFVGIAFMAVGFAFATRWE